MTPYRNLSTSKTLDHQSCVGIYFSQAMPLRQRSSELRRKYECSEERKAASVDKNRTGTWELRVRFIHPESVGGICYNSETQDRE